MWQCTNCLDPFASRLAPDDRLCDACRALPPERHSGHCNCPWCEPGEYRQPTRADERGSADGRPEVDRL